MAFAQTDRISRPRTATILLVALACLVVEGCSLSGPAISPTEHRIDEEWSEYQRALHTWNPSYGEEFLAQFPNSPYAQRIREHTEELKRMQADRPAYEPYLRADSKEGYEEFIGKYPNNYFVPEAQAQIAELEYAPYRNLNTVSSYEQFLVRYPNHKYTQDAKERMADLEFAPSRNQDTIQAYRDFLSRYPSHKHTQLAKQHLEELTTPPQHKKAAVVYHPSEILVTPGDLSSQKYTILGSVEWPAKDTTVVTFFGSSDCNPDRLRKAAREKYSVDAIIGYTTWHDGFQMHCSGTAVQFVTTPPEPSGTDFQQGGKQERSAEERLKEIRGLLDQGLITQGEYERKRQEILNELR